jgi:para-nitrobenzyl esterase
LPYVFQTPWAVATPSFDPAQRVLSNRIQTYWGDFARSGDPNGTGVTAWPADDGRGPLRLSPTDPGVAGDFAAIHHCGFWNALGY